MYDRLISRESIRAASEHVFTYTANMVQYVSALIDTEIRFQLM